MIATWCCTKQLNMVVQLRGCPLPGCHPYKKSRLQSGAHAGGAEGSRPSP